MALGVFLSSCQKDEDMFNPANGLDDASLRTYQGNHSSGYSSQSNGGSTGDPNPGGGDPTIKDGDDTEDDDDDDQIKDGDDTEDDDDDDATFIVIPGHQNLPGVSSQASDQ